MLSLNFFDLVILLGVLQGLIVSILFFTQRPKHLSGRLMAVLILIIALASLNIFLINQKWFQASSTLQFIQAVVPLVLIMPVGPLIFFYIQSVTNPSFRLTGKKRLHFITIFIDLLPKLIALIYIFGVSTRLLNAGHPSWGQFIDAYNIYADIPRWISVSIYIILSYRFLRKCDLHIRKNLDDVTKWKLRWLREFLLVFSIFQCIWLIQLVPYVIPAYSGKFIALVNWYPLYIPLTIIAYWLSFRGYQASIRQFRTEKRTYQGFSAMAPETIQHAALLLKRSMEQDRVYLNAELNLHTLSQHTGLPQKTISAVVNQYYGKSFSEFVNEYRIQEIKIKMLAPENRNLTIAGIAFICGFNSQPTFHRSFKSITGHTPSEYLEKNSQKQEL